MRSDIPTITAQERRASHRRVFKALAGLFCILPGSTIRRHPQPFRTENRLADERQLIEGAYPARWLRLSAESALSHVPSFAGRLPREEFVRLDREAP